MSEDYPRSTPQASATATIKVSLDEVVIADRRANVELMTDGLSGCVAVALKSGDKIGLTHIYSDALGRFDDYREPLKAFARTVANGGEITEAYVVHNGNVLEKGRDQTLPDMVRGCLAEQGLVRRGGIVELVDNGCTLSEQGLFFKRRDNVQVYDSGGHTNSALEHLDSGVASDLRGRMASGALFRPSEHVRASGYAGAFRVAVDGGRIETALDGGLRRAATATQGGSGCIQAQARRFGDERTAWIGRA